jgi:hypothetical protein
MSSNSPAAVASLTPPDASLFPAGVPAWPAGLLTLLVCAAWAFVDVRSPWAQPQLGFAALPLLATFVPLVATLPWLVGLLWDIGRLRGWAAWLSNPDEEAAWIEPFRAWCRRLLLVYTPGELQPVTEEWHNAAQTKLAGRWWKYLFVVAALPLLGLVLGLPNPMRPSTHTPLELMLPLSAGLIVSGALMAGALFGAAVGDRALNTYQFRLRTVFEEEARFRLRSPQPTRGPGRGPFPRPLATEAETNAETRLDSPAAAPFPPTQPSNWVPPDLAARPGKRDDRSTR